MEAVQLSVGRWYQYLYLEDHTKNGNSCTFGDPIEDRTIDVFEDGTFISYESGDTLRRTYTIKELYTQIPDGNGGWVKSCDPNLWSPVYDSVGQVRKLPIAVINERFYPKELGIADGTDFSIDFATYWTRQ